MHFGNLNNPKTQAGKLYAILSAEPGKLFDAWDLAMALPTTAIGTIVSEVRNQLPPDVTVEHVSPARKLHYYRLVPTGQMDLGL